jgi:uncharacterized protein YwgA
MYLEATCADVNMSTWEKLMKGAKRTSYRKLVSLIKKELPVLYFDLALNLYNPWSNQTKQTETHFILVHSATEYFFRKDQTVTD